MWRHNMAPHSNMLSSVSNCVIYNLPLLLSYKYDDIVVLTSSIFTGYIFCWWPIGSHLCPPHPWIRPCHRWLLAREVDDNPVKSRSWIGFAWGLTLRPRVPRTVMTGALQKFLRMKMVCVAVLLPSGFAAMTVTLYLPSLRRKSGIFSWLLLCC